MSKSKPLAEKFWSKVQVEGCGESSDPLATSVGECWLWLGAKTSQGYGLITHEGKQINAHRVSLILHGIELGPNTDHLCRVRLCVNPSHLESVSIAENSKRGLSSSATALRTGKCKRGHELIGDNLTTEMKNGKFYRKCRACANLHAANYRERMRSKDNLGGSNK